MNLICPFLSKLPFETSHGEYYLCPGDCALWVISEEMCSFRLLADNIAIDRKLARKAAQEAAQRGGPGP